MLPATHSLEFRVHTRVLLTLLVVLLITTAVLAEPPHRTLVREATAAQQAGDTAVAIAKWESVAGLRPDYPRAHLTLARLYTAANRGDDALARLQRLAGMGLAFGVKDDSAFAPLATRDEFAAIASRFTRNSLPQGIASVAVTLREQAGLIECAGQRTETGEWFFGDVRQRCIWRRAPDGRLSRFPDDADQPGGVFALVVDEDRGALWISTSSLPQVRGHTEAEAGTAALREYDLASGRLRRSLDLPRREGGRVIGSLALAADGTVYATDSIAPEIWRAAPGAARAELFVTDPNFVSLQGLALLDDDRTLVVADYANGLWQLATTQPAPSLLAPPADATFFGIDALATAGDGLVAVQNGVNPQRVLFIRPARDGQPAAVEVLAAGQPGFDDLATGAVVDGRFHVVAASGWALFDDPAATPAPRNVLLFSTPLP